MAISFPRSLPVLPVSDLQLDIRRKDLVSQGGDARLGSVTAGFPVWTLTLAASPNTETASETWAAWVDSLEGSSRQFYARDLTRPLPLAHARTGLPMGWDGVCTGWTASLDGAGSAELVLNGCPDGLQLRPGDRVGFRWGDHQRALVKVMELAFSAGGFIGPAIRPAVPSVVPSDAVAYLVQPEVLMRLDPDNTAVGPLASNRTRTIAIAAVQDLVP